MSTAVVRRQFARAPAGAVQEFVLNLESLTRYATQVEKLPRADLIKQLSATRGGQAVPAALVREMDMLKRSIEQLCNRLETHETSREVASRERQGSQHLQKMARDKALLEPSELADRLAWTRQALSKALKAHRVFFVETQGTRYYPAFYADSRYQRSHIEGVSKILGELPGTSKLQFFLTPKGSLGGKTPLDALADGQYSSVKVAAEGFAQR